MRAECWLGWECWWPCGCWWWCISERRYGGGPTFRDLSWDARNLLSSSLLRRSAWLVSRDSAEKGLGLVVAGGAAADAAETGGRGGANRAPAE